MLDFKQFLKKHISNDMIYLKEYISNDIIYLKKYLNMSDEQKKDYLPEEYPDYFEDFLYENDIEFDPPETEFFDGNGVIQYGDKLNGYELMDWLRDNDRNLYDNYANYIFDRLKYGTLPIPDEEYPSWVYFDKSKIVKNQWLIHFTDNSYNISKEGFKRGVSNMEKLGLTTWGGDYDKKYGGYNFAYDINDFQRYGRKRDGYKYGTEAVLFRASGIKTYHWGDEEPQVIFYGKLATDIIPIINDGNDWTITSIKNDRVLYKNENLEDVVQWIIKNFNQYRKSLLK